MPKIKYEDIAIQKKGLALIEQVNVVIDDFQAQGYSLTLRQAYYQLVSKNIIPNNEREYTNLGNLVNRGRLAGLIDWSAIIDRTRNLRQNAHWNSPEEIIQDAADSYAIDLWEWQPCYLEIWVEKDALFDIVEQAVESLDVPRFSTRGYGSASEYWGAAQRIIKRNKAGKQAIILHLADHDSSGIDMSRDIQKRLNLFGADVSIVRLALNMSQIQQYKPPPNPAKLTDTRADKYIAQFGNKSFELDALEPRILTALIQDGVKKYLDYEMFERAQAQQEREREKLLALCS